jgi:hypothetical protein
VSARLAMVAALAVALTGPAAVRADDTMRCGGRVISVGMSKSDVLAACGEPTAAEDVPQPVRSGTQIVGQTVQSRWTYASNTVTRVFVFDQDRLIRIDVN